MLSRLQWLLLQLSRQVWLRAAAFSVLGILTALIALFAKRYIPADLPTKIGSDAVDSLLEIIASSMLSVTIFSLSTMVSAYASATSNVTPRATQLLVEDSTAQNALATFIGSFLFSLVGIIVLKTGLYGETGRVVLYVVTLVVIVLIVLTLLRWIDYVLRLGRVQPTTRRVEKAAGTAMKRRMTSAFLDGTPRPEGGGDVPEDAIPVLAASFGYVQHIDMQALQEVGDSADASIYIEALPGRLVDPTTPLGFVLGDLEEAAWDKVRDGFTVSHARSFDQDPRFGLCVLSEIASRALSPALNDPGTAIDVLGRGARVLAMWARPADRGKDDDDGNPATTADDECRFPRVRVPPLLLDELFDDFFTPIARDGAAIVEVMVHLMKALQGLAGVGGDRYRSAARRHARHALARAEAAMRMPEDLIRVRRAAQRVLREEDIAG